MLAKEDLNLSARVVAVEVEDKAALQQQLAEAKAALQQLGEANAALQQQLTEAKAALQQLAEAKAALQQQQAEQQAALQQQLVEARCEPAESKGEHVGAGMYHTYISSCYYIYVCRHATISVSYATLHILILLERTGPVEVEEKAALQQQLAEARRELALGKSKLALLGKLSASLKLAAGGVETDEVFFLKKIALLGKLSASLKLAAGGVETRS